MVAYLKDEQRVDHGALDRLYAEANAKLLKIFKGRSPLLWSLEPIGSGLPGDTPHLSGYRRRFYFLGAGATMTPGGTQMDNVAQAYLFVVKNFMDANPPNAEPWFRQYDHTPFSDFAAACHLAAPVLGDPRPVTDERYPCARVQGPGSVDLWNATAYPLGIQRYAANGGSEELFHWSLEAHRKAFTVGGVEMDYYLYVDGDTQAEHPDLWTPVDIIIGDKIGATFDWPSNYDKYSFLRFNNLQGNAVTVHFHTRSGVEFSFAIPGLGSRCVRRIPSTAALPPGAVGGGGWLACYEYFFSYWGAHDPWFLSRADGDGSNITDALNAGGMPNAAGHLVHDTTQFWSMANPGFGGGASMGTSLLGDWLANTGRLMALDPEAEATREAAIGGPGNRWRLLRRDGRDARGVANVQVTYDPPAYDELPTVSEDGHVNWRLAPGPDGSDGQPAYYELEWNPLPEVGVEVVSAGDVVRVTYDYDSKEFIDFAGFGTLGAVLEPLGLTLTVPSPSTGATGLEGPAYEKGFRLEAAFDLDLVGLTTNLIASVWNAPGVDLSAGFPLDVKGFYLYGNYIKVTLAERVLEGTYKSDETTWVTVQAHTHELGIATETGGYAGWFETMATITARWIADAGDIATTSYSMQFSSYGPWLIVDQVMDLEYPVNSTLGATGSPNDQVLGTMFGLEKHQGPTPPGGPPPDPTWKLRRTVAFPLVYGASGLVGAPTLTRGFGSEGFAAQRAGAVSPWAWPEYGDVGGLAMTYIRADRQSVGQRFTVHPPSQTVHTAQALVVGAPDSTAVLTRADGIVGVTVTNVVVKRAGAAVTAGHTNWALEDNGNDTKKIVWNPTPEAGVEVLHDGDAVTVEFDSRSAEVFAPSGDPYLLEEEPFVRGYYEPATGTAVPLFRTWDEVRDALLTEDSGEEGEAGWLQVAKGIRLLGRRIGSDVFARLAAWINYAVVKWRDFVVGGDGYPVVSAGQDDYTRGSIGQATGYTALRGYLQFWPLTLPGIGGGTGKVLRQGLVLEAAQYNAAASAVNAVTGKMGLPRPGTGLTLQGLYMGEPGYSLLPDGARPRTQYVGWSDGVNPELTAWWTARFADLGDGRSVKTSADFPAPFAAVMAANQLWCWVATDGSGAIATGETGPYVYPAVPLWQGWGLPSPADMAAVRWVTIADAQAVMASLGLPFEWQELVCPARLELAEAALSFISGGNVTSGSAVFGPANAAVWVNDPAGDWVYWNDAPTLWQDSVHHLLPYGLRAVIRASVAAVDFFTVDPGGWAPDPIKVDFGAAAARMYGAIPIAGIFLNDQRANTHYLWRNYGGTPYSVVIWPRNYLKHAERNGNWLNEQWWPLVAAEGLESTSPKVIEDRGVPPDSPPGTPVTEFGNEEIFTSDVENGWLEIVLKAEKLSTES